MLVRVSGSTIDVIAVQSAKAPEPRLVRPVGSLIDVIDVSPRKRPGGTRALPWCSAHAASRTSMGASPSRVGRAGPALGALRIDGPTLARCGLAVVAHRAPQPGPVGHRVLTAAVAMNSGSTAEKRARPEAETILSPAARPMRHALECSIHVCNARDHEGVAEGDKQGCGEADGSTLNI
jgi:hypothetical protein